MTPRPLPGPPGAAPPSALYPDAPPIAPDARVPTWVWALMVAVPILLFGFWLFYDPSRGDLRAFDNRLKPVLIQVDGIDRALNANLGFAPKIETVTVFMGTIVPLQQKVVDEAQSLGAYSDEALFSRDQFIDAETDMLDALQSMANATNDNELRGGGEAMKAAEQEFMVWKADYAYLLKQHHVK